MNILDDGGKRPFFVGTVISKNQQTLSGAIPSSFSYANTPTFINGIIVRGSAMVPETVQSGIASETSTNNQQRKGSRVKRIKSVALKRMSKDQTIGEEGKLIIAPGIVLQKEAKVIKFKGRKISSIKNEEFISIPAGFENTFEIKTLEVQSKPNQLIKKNQAKAPTQYYPHLTNKPQGISQHHELIVRQGPLLTENIETFYPKEQTMISNFNKTIQPLQGTLRPQSAAKGKQVTKEFVPFHIQNLQQQPSQSSMVLTSSTLIPKMKKEETQILNKPPVAPVTIFKTLEQIIATTSTAIPGYSRYSKGPQGAGLDTNRQIKEQLAQHASKYVMSGVSTNNTVATQSQKAINPLIVKNQSASYKGAASRNAYSKTPHRHNGRPQSSVYRTDEFKLRTNSIQMDALLQPSGILITSPKAYNGPAIMFLNNDSPMKQGSIFRQKIMQQSSSNQSLRPVSAAVQIQQQRQEIQPIQKF